MMDDKVIETEWLHALGRAATEEDEDFRYALCERFLNRAVARIAADKYSFAQLKTQWFARPRRDKDCAALARRILRVLPTDLHTHSIVEIIAGTGTDDVATNPTYVGTVCADVARRQTRSDMWTAQMRAQRDAVPLDGGMADLVADIARRDEQRLQMLDVQEELVLLARWKGEAE